MSSFYVLPSYAQTPGQTRVSGYGSGPSSSSSSGAGGFGAALMAAGAASGAIGSFYAALNQRSMLKSQALSYEFEGSMADLSARSAEDDAMQTLLAGQQEAGRASLQYGQAAAAQKVGVGASGTQIGVGSAAEAAASIQLAKQIDLQTIHVNSVRAAGNDRMRAVELRNRAMMARVNAENARSTARSIKPWAAAGTSLLSSGAQFAAMGAF